MHRTLKAETTRPAAGSLGAQQRRFNVFREEFNHERPHEALDQETPAACYAPEGCDKRWNDGLEAGRADDGHRSEYRFGVNKSTLAETGNRTSPS